MIGLRALLVAAIAVASGNVAAQNSTSPSQPSPARLIDADDLQVAPRRFLNQLIELRDMRCLNADVDEFRCVSANTSGLMLLTTTITPKDVRERIEKSCATLREVMTPQCRFTVRLKPETLKQDMMDGMQRRTVVLTKEIEAVPPARPNRR
jgi:hypothetical protein